MLFYRETAMQRENSFPNRAWRTSQLHMDFSLAFALIFLDLTTFLRQISRKFKPIAQILKICIAAADGLAAQLLFRARAGFFSANCASRRRLFISQNAISCEIKNVPSPRHRRNRSHAYLLDLRFFKSYTSLNHTVLYIFLHDLSCVHTSVS